MAVRLDTIALAIVILACLIVAARIGRRTPVDTDRSPDDKGPDQDDPNHLRRDDLLYVAVAAVPGAVVGGRLGYALVHLDYYTANPSALLDITQGSLSLSLAVVGGFLTASIVAGLLGAPVGRWMHALVLPLLLALAGGKLAMALGGSGQGVPWDGDWATAYLGPGPWGSLAPGPPVAPVAGLRGSRHDGRPPGRGVPAGDRPVQAAHGCRVPARDRPVGPRARGGRLHLARSAGPRSPRDGAGGLSRDRGGVPRPHGRAHRLGRGAPTACRGSRLRVPRAARAADVVHPTCPHGRTRRIVPGSDRPHTARALVRSSAARIRRDLLVGELDRVRAHGAAPGVRHDRRDIRLGDAEGCAGGVPPGAPSIR